MNIKCLGCTKSRSLCYFYCSHLCSHTIIRHTFLWNLLPSLILLGGGGGEQQRGKREVWVCMLWENEGDKILEIVKGTKMLHTALAIARWELGYDHPAFNKQPGQCHEAAGLGAPSTKQQAALPVPEGTVLPSLHRFYLHSLCNFQADLVILAYNVCWKCRKTYGQIQRSVSDGDKKCAGTSSWALNSSRARIF